MSRKVLSIDCEMVLCRGNKESLAHVTVVDSGLQVVYDSFVNIPAYLISDLRQNVTGIKQENLQSGKPLATVCEEVKNLLKNSTVVGHSLVHDFDALGFCPEISLIRDTQTFPDFQQSTRCRAASLTHVAEAVLNFDLKQSRLDRGGVHSATEDATVAMRLYLKVADKWEDLVKRGLYRYSEAVSRANCDRQALKKANKLAADASSSGQHRLSTSNRFRADLLDDGLPADANSDDEWPDADDIPHWYGRDGEGADEYGYWADEGEWVPNYD